MIVSLVQEKVLDGCGVRELRSSSILATVAGEGLPDSLGGGKRALSTKTAAKSGALRDLHPTPRAPASRNSLSLSK